jgi:hypothetical protein
VADPEMLDDFADEGSFTYVIPRDGMGAASSSSLLCGGAHHIDRQRRMLVAWGRARRLGL